MAADDEDDCKFYEVGCRIADEAGEAVEGIVGQVALDWMSAAAELIEWLGTRWLHWSPGVDTESNAVAEVQGNLMWYTAGLAILGILLALGRMVLSQDFKTLIGAAKPIVNLIIVTGAYAAGIRGLDHAGNELAIWLFEEIETNHGESAGLEAIATILTASVATGNVAVIGNAGGGLLIISLLALLSSALLFGFMIFRDIMLLILMAFVPSVAASTGSETGDQAFRKMNGWLLALLLFKPVAAVIMVLGLTLIQDNTDISGEGGEGIMRPLSGVLIVCLAAIALPALVKFVVPAAAVGAAAFSGGAAVGAGAATVAAGAAVVATVGTGGAAAGGGGVAAGARSAGTAGGASAAGGSSSGGSTVAGGSDGPTGGSPVASGGGGSNPAPARGTNGESKSREAGDRVPSTGSSGSGGRSSSENTGSDSPAPGPAADKSPAGTSSSASDWRTAAGGAPAAAGGMETSSRVSDGTAAGASTASKGASVVQPLSEGVVAAQGSVDEAVEDQE